MNKQLKDERIIYILNYEKGKKEKITHSILTEAQMFTQCLALS